MLGEVKAAKNGLISMNLWMIPRTPRTKTTDYTDWHRFFCGICEICGFNHPIGVNLCQSVDRDAKVAKDTKGAKGNARAQRKQRRRGHKEKATDYTD